MDQNRTPLLDAVAAYAKERPTYFKIPGHRYERGISERWKRWTGDGIFRFDLTEAEGLDDLHRPQGVIREAQELCAKLYGARKTFFLVNGTTCGNEAMILSCAYEGEKILVARNAHKSALMGLILSGARPVWLMPRIDQATGLCGSVTPESVEAGFRGHPDARGVFLVSPTYYGVTSDLQAIAKICHAHGAMLLVDEAHGGHLYFQDKVYGTENLPQGALRAGADLCAQSMHKVTGSLTQSSLLHIGTGRADEGRVAENLRLVQSTSPSYLLMTSLDAARCELAMHGGRMLGDALRLAQDARQRIRAIDGMECYGSEAEGGAIHGLDLTRLCISAARLGISGYELTDRLYRDYRVGMELADEARTVAVVTYANEAEDIDRLVGALADITRTARPGRREPSAARPVAYPGLPEYILSPREAYRTKKRSVKWAEAKGKIAGEALIPYPPGIPLVNPGERLEPEIWEYMNDYRRRGLPFHGPADPTLSVFGVLDEQK